MGRRSRCLCALLACAALFAGAGLFPRTASADDWSDPAQGVQTSSSSSSGSVQNDNTTVQQATPTQIGASQQTQTTIQLAPTDQTANAGSRSTQRGANVASGGTTEQQNTSSSSAAARNVNEASQSSAQKQAGGNAPPPDPAPSSAQSQTSSQSAPTSQHADATATSNQVAPTNINISVRVNSPGDNGPVNQTNTSTASASSDNANSVTQGVNQSQSDSSRPGSQSQSASQNVPTTQVGNATSTSTQVAPTNLDITIRNKSPGDDGAVTQTNDTSAKATVTNANDANQAAGQVQTNGGVTSGGRIVGGNGWPCSYMPHVHQTCPPASSPQPTPAGTTESQDANQNAPTRQSGNATAISKQEEPANGAASVTLSEGVPDPNGSGRQGTLIQIWIPDGGATQTNSSNADAAAVNSNRTTQVADQHQTAPSGGATQVGGASQTQTLRQSAPTTQSGTANATSAQTGALNLADGGSAIQTNTSLSQATIDNVNQTTQSALQIQDGGLPGGTQAQVVEQTAPTVQTAIAQSLSVLTGATNVGADGWSLQTNVSSAVVSAGKSSQTTQSAEQIQVGTSHAGAQLQVIEQSASNAAHAQSRQTCGRRCRSSLSGTVSLEQDFSVWSTSAGRHGSSTSRQSGAAKQKKERAPRDGRLPRVPDLPGAGAGASSGGGGGSLWVFAALLIPFALTGSWLARHYGPSAFRRLTGVVVRPERPG